MTHERGGISKKMVSAQAAKQAPFAAASTEDKMTGKGPMRHAVTATTLCLLLQEKELGPVAGKPWTSAFTSMEFVWVKKLGMWVGKYEVTNANTPGGMTGRRGAGRRETTMTIPRSTTCELKGAIVTATLLAAMSNGAGRIRGGSTAWAGTYGKRVRRGGGTAIIWGGDVWEKGWCDGSSEAWWRGASWDYYRQVSLRCSSRSSFFFVGSGCGFRLVLSPVK